MASSRKILLVEDNATNRLLVKKILTKKEFEIVEATNGQEAIDAVLSGDYTFDIILMDMQMPIVDGYDATRILRENGITLPIIALTANVMKADIARSLDAGCDDYLSKPIDINSLMVLLNFFLAPDS